MNVAILAVSTANLAVSVTAVIVAFRLSKKAKHQLEESKVVVNQTITSVQGALEGLKL